MDIIGVGRRHTPVIDIGFGGWGGSRQINFVVICLIRLIRCLLNKLKSLQYLPEGF